MWNLKKGNDFLPEMSLKDLQKAYAKEENAKPKLRFLVAIHRKKGESLDDIAYTVEKPRRTIHGWLHRFETRGFVGAFDKKQPGKIPALTPKQLMKLRQELIRGPPYNKENLWSVREVREHLQKRYQVNYSRIHVFRILRKLGFSVQKPRQKHYKSSAVVQAQFKKKQNVSPVTIVGVDGRLQLWTNAVSRLNLTSSKAGH